MLVFTQVYSILKYNYGTFVKTKKLTLVHYYKLSTDFISPVSKQVSFYYCSVQFSIPKLHSVTSSYKS